MSKSLIEMTTEIVAAQVHLTPLSPDDIADSVHKVFQALTAIQHVEHGTAYAETVTTDPQASIQRHQAVCLECGKAFKLLSNRHLALHGLTPRAYKQKHGIRLTQALSAQTLSAKRRKIAKERGMGKQLAAWRADRKRRAG
jgi:predicted transcriptional regulator